LLVGQIWGLHPKTLKSILKQAGIVEIEDEAIEFHLEGLKDENLPIPEPTVTARCIKVTGQKHPGR
jgi:hypothetical protein